MRPEEDPKFMHVGKAIEGHAKTVGDFCDIFATEPFDKQEALSKLEKMKAEVEAIHVLVEAL
jgi:hypothetical protein